MTVLLTHTRLRLAAASTLLAAPLTVLGALMLDYSGARAAHLKYGFIAGGVAFIFAIFFGGLLLRGRRLGVFSAVGLVALVLLWSTRQALLHGDTSLGLYLIVISALTFAWASWALHELGRSFFDPRVRWFQGLPKPLPRVECEIASNLFQVSRLDREGAFVFSSRGTIPEFAESKKTTLPITFLFRDRRISCTGVPVRTLDRVRKRSGIGIQFQEMSADSKKVLGDFVESLKGEGYV
jgi:hypothetical protein